MNAKTGKKHESSQYVPANALADAKAFVASSELNGHWEGNVFWGTRNAYVNMRAFLSGWLAGRNTAKLEAMP